MEAEPASNSMSRNAPVKWAQRKDRLYITIDITDCTEPSIRIDKNGRLNFSGKGGSDQATYAVELELYEPVNEEDSKVAVTPRYIFLVVMKLQSGPHWPRLLKSPDRPPKTIKIDWDKWKDEDEEDELANAKEFNIGDLDDMHKYDEYADEELDSEGENDEDEPMNTDD